MTRTRRRKTIRSAWDAILRQAAKFGVARTWQGKGISVVLAFDCGLVIADHKASARAYAHAGHLGRDVVCIHSGLGDLAPCHIYGVLLHELGHVATGMGNEQAADRWVLTRMGVNVKYARKSGAFTRKDLEYVDKEPWME